jgi:hypothetical protein
MSYCKINIGGKERGLKFNQMAVLILQEKTDKEFPIQSGAYALVYGGLKANCFVSGVEADFTWQDVCEWVEDMDTDTMNIVTAAFKETQAYKQGAAFQAAEEAAKKKGKKKLPMKNTG